MNVKFKKLHADAKAPQRMTDGAAGYDLVAVSYSGYTGQHVYGTGLAVEIPPGYVGLLFPRSSVSKTGMSLCNSTGIIDADFRGEILLKFYGIEPGKRFAAGERVGQLIIMPVPQVQFVEATELSDTTRGAGGFGSSGA